MSTRIKTRPRETPLCIEHFLSFARTYREGQLSEMPLSSTQEHTPQPSASPSPARVQPSRAAKNKCQVYHNSSVQKRKIEDISSDDDDVDDESRDEESSDDDDEPIRRKRARLDEGDASYEEPDQPSPKEQSATPPTPLYLLKQRQLKTEIKNLETRVQDIAQAIEDKYAHTDTNCVFGLKPMECSRCVEHKSGDVGKFGTPPLCKTCGIANEAQMEPWACELLLEWDVELPEEYRFEWEGMEFAVDSCDQIMILML